MRQVLAESEFDQKITKHIVNGPVDSMCQHLLKA